MKTIVIADIHQRTKDIEIVLKREKDYDEVIFLGDWFDSFFEPPEVSSFGDTCQYLKYLMLEHPHKEKFVFLVGNHDINYIYHNDKLSREPVATTGTYFCSGFTKEKAIEFRRHFFDQGLKDTLFFEKFKMAHHSQNFIFSHAGLDPRHIPASQTSREVVETILPDAWKNFRNNNHPHNWLISAAGYCRGGMHPIGGVLWLDWRREFSPSEKVGRQIVGHTTMKAPTVEAQGSKSESWNLDTEAHYGIVIDGSLEINSIKKKKKELSKRTQNLSNWQLLEEYLKLTSTKK